VDYNNIMEFIIKAVESKEDIGIENIKLENYINFDNEFLENFKKINYNNSEIILQSLENVIKDIRVKLDFIVEEVNKKFILNLNSSNRESIIDIISYTEDIKSIVDIVLKEISNFKFRFREDDFNYNLYLQKIYTKIIKILDYSVYNQMMIKSYIYEKIPKEYILFKGYGEYEEFEFINKESCFQIINKLVIMLNTNDIIKSLINLKNENLKNENLKNENLKNENESFKINELIFNIIDFQAKVLEYKYIIEYEINIPLEIIKYKDITKEIENNILNSLDSIVGHLEDPTKGKIVSKYKENFRNINKNIMINDIYLLGAMDYYNNNTIRHSIKFYSSKDSKEIEIILKHKKIEDGEDKIKKNIDSILKYNNQDRPKFRSEVLWTL